MLLTLAAWLVVRGAAADDAGLRAVRLLLDGGRYEEAEAQAQALVNTDGSASVSVVARQILVEALLANGRGATPHALAVARALTGTKPVAALTAADALNERLLGQVLLESAQYRAAGEHLHRALRAHERVRGPAHPDVADDLDAIVELRLWQEEYGGATAASDRALAIRESSGGAPAALARTLELRTLLWQRRSDAKQARAALDRALPIRDSAGASQAALVRALTLSGEQLRLEGDLNQSLAVLQRAVATAEASLRDGHPETASALRSLASRVHRLPAHAEAKRLRERALAIAEAAYGPSHPNVAIQLNDLANSYEAIGEYGTSRRLMRRALSIYETTLGPSYSGSVTAMYNLGNRYVAIGDYPEAIRLFRRAIAIWTRSLGPNHRYLAYPLGGLGDALSKVGRHREAVSNLERALRLWETQFGRDSPAAADVLLVLADSLSRLGDLTRARDAVDRALAISEKAGSADNVAEGSSIQARIATAAGDDAGARAAAARALTLSVPVYGASHPKIGALKTQLAGAMAATGEPAAALAEALEAERIGREHLQRTLAYLPERQALRYVAERPRGLDLALSFSTAGSADSVLDALIRGRSLTLDEMAARRRAVAHAAEPAIAPLWAALLEATERLTELAVGGPRGDPAAYQALLLDAQRTRERAETALADASVEIRQAVERREIGLDDVRAALPQGAAVVSFVRFGRTTARAPSASPLPRRSRVTPEYAAFVLRAGTPPTLVELGSAHAIERAVADWRRGVVALADPELTEASAEAALRRLGRPLRRLVWDPLTAHLAGAAQVLVVPDGTINLLAFAALPTDGPQYLVEAGPTIHYLSSERDLVAPAEAVPEAKGLLAIGGPAYGTPPAAVPAQTQTARTQAATMRAPACGSFENVFFPELPAARREAEDVGALWRQLAGDTNGVHTLVGARASEAAFKELGPGHRILHLATHGFFLGGTCDDARPGRRSIGRLNRPGAKPTAAPPPLPENPLLWSGLALAGANRRAAKTAGEDGILTAEEVAALDLDGVEWAVLSACDTGVGEIRVGEGVFGLRRAFRVAGARTVVMSLWEVDDRAARAWMRPLYEGRLKDRLSTADAVRHASLTVLRDRRARGLSTHPFFWAGFVAAGDWR